MNRCEILKSKRIEDGLSQVALSKKIGVAANTISYLETDETRWASMYAKTVDKINGYLDGTLNDVPVKKPVKKVDVEPKQETPIVVICESKKDNNVLTEDDKKTLTLIEFAYEGLNDSKTHDDFMAYIHMLKRILNKYEN